MRKQIPLSDWTRSLCKSAEYPAFDEPEPVVLPDTIGEQRPGFSGYACYETTFMLDSPKPLLLEISDVAGRVEVFINGGTAGMWSHLPYCYDLSDLAWQGQNYLAIEVAITPERECAGTKELLTEKTRHTKPKKLSGITGFVRLYTT
ncbi:MAG: hypothetical protein LBB83_02245 [Treponema sp.]|jgi:hypothetical protein|nr:hypothetical protein [Treponema sp.]